MLTHLQVNCNSLRFAAAFYFLGLFRPQGLTALSSSFVS